MSGGAAAAALRVALESRCRFPDSERPMDVAVSGGADSLALLLLSTLSGRAVTAWHVDHGLRPGGNEEAEVVRAAAERFDAGFRSVEVRVEPGPNLEARARAARFRALPDDIATGHTADDQAETVLINLMRGASTSGLAGMRAGHRHPMLDLRRSETHQLCAAFGLEAIEDPTNLDLGFQRNLVRRHLLPLLCQVAGRDLVPVIVRQAKLAADESDFMDGLARRLDCADASGLARSDLAVARRAVRLWLATVDGHPPSSADVERVLAVARMEARATQVEGGRTVTRSKGRLTVEGRHGESPATGLTALRANRRSERTEI